MRSKEQLVALRPMGDVLGMATMHLRRRNLPPDRIDEVPEASRGEDAKRELDIARQLVESLAGDFEPEKYSDTYREAGARADRAQGCRARRSRCSPPTRSSAAPAPDLMSALKASLDAVRAREGDGARQGRRRNGPGQKGARRQSARPRNRPLKNGRRRSPQPSAARCLPARKLASYSAKRDFQATPEPAPRRRRRPRAGAALRHPRAPRAATALGPAPGARWRARLVGGPQGPARGARREPLRGGHRGSSARVPRLRRARSPRASTAPARSTIWDHGTYDCLKWEPRKIEVALHGERLTRATRCSRSTRTSRPATG